MYNLLVELKRETGAKKMDPIAFTVLGLPIRWYGIIIALGITVAMLLAMREAKRLGHNPEHIIDICLFAIPTAIFGARLYYVIFMWNEIYRHNPMEALNIRGGGLAIHGGVLGGIIAGYIVCRVKKLEFLKFADIVAPSIILGQAIGRWGNYVNQEAYGSPTDLPWGILIEGQRVHPTFFYEFVWNLIVFSFLMWYRKRKKVDGELIFLYAILYSIGRSLIEILRIDSLWVIPGVLTAVHFTSIIVVSFSLIMIYRIRRNKKVNN